MSKSKSISLSIAMYNLGDLAQDAPGLESYRAGVETTIAERWPDAEVTVDFDRASDEDQVDARGFEDGDEIAEVEAAALVIAQDVWSDPAAWAPVA